MPRVVHFGLFSRGWSTLALFDGLWWGFGLLTGLYFDSGATSSGIFRKLNHFKNNILLSILALNGHHFLFNSRADWGALFSVGGLKEFIRILIIFRFLLIVLVVTSENLHLLAINNLNLFLSTNFEGHSFFLFSGFRIMESHMTNEVSFMSECTLAFGTLMGFLLWLWWHIIWIVVEVLMPFEELFLPETLVTSITLKGFLISVNQHM